MRTVLCLSTVLYFVVNPVLSLESFTLFSALYSVLSPVSALSPVLCLQSCFLSFVLSSVFVSALYMYSSRMFCLDSFTLYSVLSEAESATVK